MAPALLPASLAPLPFGYAVDAGTLARRVAGKAPAAPTSPHLDALGQQLGMLGLQLLSAQPSNLGLLHVSHPLASFSWCGVIGHPMAYEGTLHLGVGEAHRANE